MRNEPKPTAVKKGSGTVDSGDLHILSVNVLRAVKYSPSAVRCGTVSDVESFLQTGWRAGWLARHAKADSCETASGALDAQSGAFQTIPATPVSRI